MAAADLGLERGNGYVSEQRLEAILLVNSATPEELKRLLQQLTYEKPHFAT